MKVVVIEVPGRPVAKARPRVGWRGAVSTEATRSYETKVAWMARGARLPEGALSVSIEARWRRPQSRPRTVDRESWATGQQVPRATIPDADNIAKSVLDGLQLGPLDDDSRVSSLLVRTVYAAEGEPEGVTIVIEPDRGEA